MGGGRPSSEHFAPSQAGQVLNSALNSVTKVLQHTLCPSWQEQGPICHAAALAHPHVPGRTATYGGLAEKTAVLGGDAAWPPRALVQLHNPCHTRQGQIHSR